MRGRWLLALAACALFGAGVTAGTGGALLASPLCLWAAGLARANDPSHGPFAAGAGAASLGLGLLLLLAGRPSAAGLAALAAALLSLRAVAVPTAERGARRGSPARAEGLAPSWQRRLAGATAVFIDQLARCAWRLRFRLRGAVALADLSAAVRGAARSLRHQPPASAGALHPLPPVLEKPRARRMRTPAGGLEIRFESSLEEGPGGAAPGTATEPALAHAWLLRGEGEEPRPTVVCIHALGGGQPWRELRRFDAAGLRRTGLDVAFLTLPLHGPRRQRRRPWPAGDPLVVSGIVTQAVFELRRLLGWLRREGAPALAVYGEQIGGTVAALAAAQDRRLAALVVRSTPASLPDCWLAELGERDRLALAAMGMSRAALEDAWSPAAILGVEPRLETDRRLIVAGARDRICTPEQTEALWEHWGRPPMHWHPGGHLLALSPCALHGAVRAHLRERLLEAVSARDLPLTRFRS